MRCFYEGRNFRLNYVLCIMYLMQPATGQVAQLQRQSSNHFIHIHSHLHIRASTPVAIVSTACAIVHDSYVGSLRASKRTHLGDDRAGRIQHICTRLFLQEAIAEHWDTSHESRLNGVDATKWHVE